MAARFSSLAFLLFLIVLPSLPFANPSQNKPDSLFQVLESSPPDSSRAIVMVKICKWASQHDGNLLDSLASELDAFSSQIGYAPGRAHAAAFIGIARYFTNEVNLSDSLFGLAAQRFEKVGNMEEALTNRTKSGIMQMILGDFEGATETYNHSIAQARRYELSAPLAHALNEKATIFHYQGKTDSARHYYQQAIEISRASGQTSHYERALYNSSVLATESGDLRDANQLLQKLYESQKEANTSLSEQGKTLSAMGENYRLLGNYNLSIEKLLLGIEVLETVGDNGFVPVTYFNLARIYRVIGDTAQYELFFEKAYSRAKEASAPSVLIHILNEKGDVLFDQDQHKEALSVYDEALSLAEKNEMQAEITKLFCMIASVHVSMGDSRQALKNLQQAEAYAYSQTPPLSESYLHVAWTEYYLYLEDYQQALQSGKQAWKTAESSENLHRKEQVAHFLYQTYKGLNQPAEALKFFELEKNFSDSLLNEDKIRDLAVAQYQAEKQLLVSKSRQQEELLAVEQQARRSQRNAFLGGILALGLILFVLYRSYRIKAKANQALAERNVTIEAQREKLDQLNQVKDRIFAILGHDLRKPALAFRGLSRKLAYLISKQDYATLHQVGQQLEADADSLHALTDNILYWALSQQEGYTFRPITFDLAESVAEVVKIFQRVAEEKNISLENNIQGQTLIEADPHATQAVLRNLLDNSLKFTPAGGRVMLSTEEEGEKIKIRVKDTGEGISPEQQTGLFSVAPKSKTGTAGEQGTGLGLHLVKQLVQKNQGELVLHSELRKGTMVEISLPKAS